MFIKSRSYVFAEVVVPSAVSKKPIISHSHGKLIMKQITEDMILIITICIALSLRVKRMIVNQEKIYFTATLFSNRKLRYFLFVKINFLFSVTNFTPNPNSRKEKPHI